MFTEIAIVFLFLLLIGAVWFWLEGQEVSRLEMLEDEVFKEEEEGGK